jgi:hypothetical protein
MTPSTPAAQQDTQILDELIAWSKKHNEYDGPSIRRFIESRRTRPHTSTPTKRYTPVQMGEISKICKLCTHETDCKQHDTAIAAKAREDELTNLQDFREEEMKNIPFDPWVFINRENKRIANLIKSLNREMKIDARE